MTKSSNNVSTNLFVIAFTISSITPDISQTVVSVR